MRFVCFCKGSRGDVQPLLAVILGLHDQHSEDKVLLLCEPSTLTGLENQLLQEMHWLTIHPLPKPCVHTDKVEEVRDKWKQELLEKEVQNCLSATKSYGVVDGILFNLFSLEGYFVALHLKVPCIALSPFLITRPPPASFKSRFIKEHPHLYEKLKETDKGQLSYKEIDHWMWRLFLNDLSEACEAAGLPSFPLITSSPSELSPPLLLYGISPSIVQRQPYWPDSVHLCGFWQLPSSWDLPVPKKLQELVKQVNGELIYIGFGSMEDYVEDCCWERLLTVLNEVLTTCSLQGILQCQSHGVIQETFHRMSLSPCSLVLWSGPASHSWLFQQCRIIVHHGGCGTLVSSLLAGKPQLICPILFDQDYWGQVVEWKGVGRLCQSPVKWTVTELCQAIKSVLCESVISEAVKLGEQLRHEAGVERAVEFINDIFRK